MVNNKRSQYKLAYTRRRNAYFEFPVAGMEESGFGHIRTQLERTMNAKHLTEHLELAGHYLKQLETYCRQYGVLRGNFDTVLICRQGVYLTNGHEEMRLNLPRR